MNIDNYLCRTHHEIIHAIWCRDSETSREVLINLETKEIIAERIDGKIVDPGRK